jgi:hypothetical protein
MNGNKTVTANFTATLTVTPSNQNVPSTAGSTTFHVVSDAFGYWSVTSSATWLTFPIINGTGTGDFSANYTANTSDTSRIGTITVTKSANGGDTGITATVTVTQAGFTPPSTVATPTFTPPAGTYTSAQNVTVSTATTGATIRYTTDGSTPSSTVGTVYTGPVAISTTTTLKAIAYKSGMNPSAVASALYTINIAPTCPHLIGDVNCTGTVDNGDLAKLANFINGDPSIPANDVGITQNGDINCTGTIDAADLAKLANAAYGIDPDGHNLPIPPNPAFVCGGNGNMNTSSGTTHVPQPNVSYLEQSLGKLAGLFIDQAEAQTTTTTSQFVGNTSVRVNNVPSDTQPLTFIKVNSRISPWPIRILWSPYGTSNTLNQYNESYYGTCDVENNAQCTAEYPANQ